MNDYKIQSLLDFVHTCSPCYCKSVWKAMKLDKQTNKLYCKTQSKKLYHESLRAQSHADPQHLHYSHTFSFQSWFFLLCLCHSIHLSVGVSLPPSPPACH